MPHPVRVTPRGDLVAVPARGTLMGNRGCLHDASGTIRRQVTAYRGWVSCLLSFKGRRRRLRTPNHYTELFFLDEATALSAGHRPCGTCRRADLKRFCETIARPAGLDASLTIPDLDARLHAERLPVGPGRIVHRAPLSTLPPGAMVEQGSTNGGACLWWNGALRPWTPHGYGEKLGSAPVEVGVITPPTMLAALRGGYVPQVHPTAAG
jgi:hypothetical protein